MFSFIFNAGYTRSNFAKVVQTRPAKSVYLQYKILNSIWNRRWASCKSIRQSVPYVARLEHKVCTVSISIFTYLHVARTSTQVLYKITQLILVIFIDNLIEK